MIAQAEDKKFYTPEEYLQFEVNSEERHEYINGEVVCVSGEVQFQLFRNIF